MCSSTHWVMYSHSCRCQRRLSNPVGFQCPTISLLSILGYSLISPVAVTAGRYNHCGGRRGKRASGFGQQSTQRDGCAPLALAIVDVRVRIYRTSENQTGQCFCWLDHQTCARRQVARHSKFSPTVTIGNVDGCVAPNSTCRSPSGPSIFDFPE